MLIKLNMGCDNREYSAPMSLTSWNNQGFASPEAEEEEKTRPEFTGFTSNLNEILEMLTWLLGFHIVLHA